MRNPGIELLRIVCCLFVVAIHTMPNPTTFLAAGDVYGVYASELVHSIVRPGLPVFFIISGYFLLNSKSMPLKQHYSKRLSAIIIPFIVYGLLHVFISRRSVGIDDVEFFFSSIVKGTTSLDIHFWFVYSITGLYLIAPLIRKALLTLSAKDSFVGFVSLIAISLYNMYFKEVHLIDDNIRYIIPIPDIGMSALLFMCGGLLRRFESKVNINQSAIIWGSGVAISCVLYYLSFNTYKFNTFPDSGIGVIAASMGMMLFFSKITVNNHIKTFICNAASHTYGAFLIHLSILRILRDYIPFTVFSSPIAFVIVVSISTLLTSLILAWFIDKTISNPIIKFMGKWAR